MNLRLSTYCSFAEGQSDNSVHYCNGSLIGEEHYGVESDACGAALKFSPNKLRAQQCYAAI